MGLAGFVSTASKVIAATWRHGSRLLLGISVGCYAAAFVLWLGAKLQLARADELWSDYGIFLILAGTVFGVLAAVKNYAERQNTKIVLIANEQESLWVHTAQPDGSAFTQFSLRFHVANMDDGALHLSKVRLDWPWISRRRIFNALVVTQHPEQNLYGRGFSIRRRSRRDCSADILVFGLVGGAQRRKPINVRVSIQDHAGRWHKLVFRDLRTPQFRQIYQPRPWIRNGLLAAGAAIVLLLAAGWSWKHHFGATGEPQASSPESPDS
jgi:hypothetical protein